ncbi:hypothetical protein Tco_1213601 [Tanacetum coccineum]
MASHHLNSLYAIKECMTCGSLYTRECCSIESLENKILVPEPDSSPCCAKCGTPVDGPYCHGCAFLRKNFEEDLLTYCVENEIFQDFQDTSNVINAPREPIVVNQDPSEKSPQGAHYGYNCPPKVPIISNPEQCNQTIAELPQTLPIVHPTCNYENENSFIYDSKPNSFNVSPSVLTYPPQLQFETYLCAKIDEEYERDCEIRIRKLKQDFNEWGSKIQKKEQSYNEEQYSTARRRMLSIPFVDEDDYTPLGDIIARYSMSKAITPDLSPKEPVDSLIMEDEHLDTILETESDEFIKSSVENLV